MSALNERSVGRSAVALTAAFLVGGYLGSVGAAQAGDQPGDNAGSPGQDGQRVTCYAYWSSREPMPIICSAVGKNGEDGAPGAVHR